jgi:dihydrodipicolinate synthase/N-acetylneuraminate lyase
VSKLALLTRESFRGPWAGLPVAWTEAEAFNENTYRSDVRRCAAAGMPGVYTGGTTGEFYAMEFDEFRAVSRATVEECHAGGIPAMIGCTSTYTRGACNRAQFAADIGADAVQIAMPFWLEIGDAQVVPFLRDVARAAGDLPLSIYETGRSRKKLTVEQHRAIREAVPSYVMVKSTAGTVGATPQGCSELSRFVNVFVAETRWLELCPLGAGGGCSSAVYWGPRFVLNLWKKLECGDWPGAKADAAKLDALFKFLFASFGARGFTDTGFDRLFGIASGFLESSLTNRGPYPSATPADVAIVRAYYEQHLPEFLER